jgi:hypothetical protein
MRCDRGRAATLQLIKTGFVGLIHWGQFLGATNDGTASDISALGRIVGTENILFARLALPGETVCWPI